MPKRYACSQRNRHDWWCWRRAPVAAGVTAGRGPVDGRFSAGGRRGWPALPAAEKSRPAESPCHFRVRLADHPDRDAWGRRAHGAAAAHSDRPRGLADYENLKTVLSKVQGRIPQPSIDTAAGIARRARGSRCAGPRCERSQACTVHWWDAGTDTARYWPKHSPISGARR